ncbi:hypothetical protein [Actinoplanes italicus]|uniref:hypothetical protein n=1 Tax=Actinoplanes italicus TaxID=113567 RepID=UPI000D07CF7D|nr:hypothetical protein [Actinoplanes italicus]
MSADGFSNPILYIEELRRLPLNRSRAPAPGTALVFRHRSGRLHSPPGGYTAGEMFFLGPRLGYRIDTTPHGFSMSFEVAAAHMVSVQGRWTVTEPADAVVERISDPAYHCMIVLRDRIAGALPPGPLPLTDLRERMAGAFAEDLTVPGGLRLTGLRAHVAPAETFTGDRVIQVLAADDDDDVEPGDPGEAGSVQLLQELADLAGRAVAEHGAGGTAGQALARFQELVTRMGGMLTPGAARPDAARPDAAPPETAPSGADRRG